MIKEKISQEQEIMPIQTTHLPSIIDPEEAVAFAAKAAKALKNIVETKTKKVIIQGEQYVEFEDWQTIAWFYGATVGIAWTRPLLEINDHKEVLGYEARAEVKRGNIKISAAEAVCFRSEPNWSNKPEFQLRSMAQTRACAKALRNVFAWVVVLAGYKPTPAEEITEETVKEVFTPEEQSAGICDMCDKEINKDVYDYSTKKLGKPLCYSCQMKIKKEKK